MLITKIFIELYWIVLIIHNIRNRRQGGLIPLLIIVNAVVIALLQYEMLRC